MPYLISAISNFEKFLPSNFKNSLSIVSSFFSPKKFDFSSSLAERSCYKIKTPYWNCKVFTNVTKEYFIYDKGQMQETNKGIDKKSNCLSLISNHYLIVLNILPHR